MNKSLLIIIAITLICYCSYGQMSVAVYNNNNANYYQKMFTSKVVIHITSIDNWLPVDKTDDYTAVLKNNPDYQKTSIATDEMLLKIAVENGDDYVCNLSIKTNLTINNIVASLVNIKTGLTEQKATATCSDLVSASSLDKAAQEIVDKLFLAPKKKAEENARTLAEQKANEEKAKAEQKSKEEKALADAERQAKVEAEREARATAEAERLAKIEAEKEAKATAEAERVLAEQKAKEEKTLAKQQEKAAKDPFSTYNVNKIVINGRKFFFNWQEISKKEVREKMVNTVALQLFNKGVKQRNAGVGLMISGTLLGCVGGVYALAGNDAMEIEWTVGAGSVYKERTKNGKIAFFGGIATAGLGAAFILTGGICHGVGKANIKKSIKNYNINRPGNTSYIEVDFGITPNSMGLVVRF